jgi:hypothetical protein
VLDVASKNRLTPQLAERFASESLFDRIARQVCLAECLPRKELYESWQVARRVHRRLRGGRLVELCAGHGLLAQILAIMDPGFRECVSIDVQKPKSAQAIANALAQRWPALPVRYVEQPIEAFELLPGDVVVSVHACGPLTDTVIERANVARAAVAVLPCCHVAADAEPLGLSGWLDPALAIDVGRAERLRRAGYRVHTQTIDAAITPKNRLLMGVPP